MTPSKLSVCLIICFVLLAASCGGGKQKAAEVTAPTSTVELSISGMTCTGCENTICSNLEKVSGVKSVTASYTQGKAIIEYEPGKVDTAMIKEVVDGLGYEALKVIPVTPGN